MALLNVKIITPEKTFFGGSSERVIARTSAGNVALLAGHAPYVANLKPSPLQIKIDGAFKTAAVSGGVIRVSPTEGVTVICPAIEWAEDIDVARAKRAKEAADAKIKENASKKEFDRAEQKLKRALNRLTVAGK